MNTDELVKAMTTAERWSQAELTLAELGLVDSDAYREATAELVKAEEAVQAALQTLREAITAEVSR